MAQRLSAADRRAQIVAVTRAMIVEEGPGSVGLRSVARRCGMTAPGVKHHFETMTDLYAAVLEQWNAEEIAIVTRIAESRGDELTLLGLADAVAFTYSRNAAAARQFDLLEVQALASDHPAHGLYPESSIRPLPITRRLAERDYEDPEHVLRLFSVTVDGLRYRWLQHPETADWWNDWLTVRDDLFSCFRKKPSAPPDPALPISPPRAAPATG